MTFQEATDLLTRDERFKATVSAMNTLLIEKGIYTQQEFEIYFCHFERIYDDAYQQEYGFWRPVIRGVVDKYLDCGNLRCGFARVRCASCAHEFLLAFSCKGRYFCPSCHQKRVLQFAEWVTQHVLEPVPYSQYVFTE